MAAEPGSNAPSFRLQPTLVDMSDADKTRLCELAGQLYASNDMFRIGLGSKRLQPMRFSVLLHPSMKGQSAHPSRARVLSRTTNAIMHIRAEFTDTGSIVITQEQMHYELASYDAGYTMALITFVEAELARLNVNPALPILSKLHILLKAVLDQATLMYCARSKTEVPAK